MNDNDLRLKILDFNLISSHLISSHLTYISFKETTICNTLLVPMSRKKRSQEATRERAAKRVKDQDALLDNNVFQQALNISEDDDQYYEDISGSKDTETWENEEQDYEMRPRKLEGCDQDVVEGLPIKINGKVERKMLRKEKKVEEEEVKVSEASDEELSEVSIIEEDDSEQEPDTEEKVIQLKEEIAELVEKIMEEPEENIACLSRLCKMAESKNINTCKFSMLALVPVFKSIIPGYKIRPLSELEKREKVSRDVSKLRNFEQTLVLNYRNYIEHLKKLSKTPNNESGLKISLGVHATQAANELASNAAHFNFRKEVFTLLIRRICKPNLSADPMAKKTIKTLELLLNEDDDGNISFDIVQILCKTIKTRSYNIEESVLNIFLSLDVLHDYDPNTKSEEEVSRVKLKKKNRIHLTRKQKKARKEMKVIEEEMERAEQAVTAEERERNQGEILKLVLSLYLNTLKMEASRLVAPVLEGLVKFGNMANYELLGDFLEVMKELLQDAEMDTLSPSEIRKTLLLIVSAFSIVSNQNQMKVHIDLSVFVDGLYSLLPYASLDSDIELSHKSLRLADPLNNEILKPLVNYSTKAELLLKALDHIFFRSRTGTKQRALAFTKRIYICMEQTPEKTTIALLKFLEKLVNRYPEVGALYSTDDRIGNGNFNMEADNIFRSNAESAVLWENHVLVNHYCPIVAKGIRSLTNRSRELTK